MTKTAIFLAALLLGASANAQDTTFNFGGSLDVQYENRDNTSDFNDDAEDRSDEFVQSTIIKVDAVKGDDLSARLEVKNLMLWGDTEAFAGKDTSLKGEDTRSNQFLITEAYGVYRVDDSQTLQFGRGKYLLGEGELVSKRDYEYIPVTFDGLLYLNDMESFRVGAFFVRGADAGFNQNDGTDNQETNDKAGDFWGATFTFKNLPDFLSDLSLNYVLATADTFAGNSITKNDRTWIGLSTKGETGMWDYHLAYQNFTGTVYSTTEIDRNGSMFHVGAGANMPEFSGLRVGLEYHQDSGDENTADAESEAYDPLYYNYQKYSGRMEVLRWGAGGNTTNALVGTGLTSMALKLSMKPADDIDVMVDYFIFEKTEDQGGNDELGSELDLVVKKSYVNGMYAQAEYGMFMPGDGVSGDDDATRLYASFGFDF